jgi:hypothetical protein
MRIIIRKHPVLLALGVTTVTLAAVAGVVSYYLSSWLILPLF